MWWPPPGIFSLCCPSPSPPGSHTIQPLNEGSQTHEVVLVKLAPAATAKDFIAAFEPGAVGPPAGRRWGHCRN